MKYIKTNEFVYETEKVIDWVEMYKDKLQPIKQADNVEELFDYKLCGGRVYPNSVDVDYIYNDFGDMFFGETIYGAIWTEKGIINVAKYKLGGEWELL